jgi:hypothetical protein
MKSFKKILAKFLLAVVLLTNLGLAGLFQVSTTEAAIIPNDIFVERIASAGGSLAINSNSGEVPIAKLRIANGSLDDWQLGTVNIAFGGAGFSPSDLRVLSLASTSGISIYKDSNGNGAFDLGFDTLVQATSSSWSTNIAQLAFDQAGAGTQLPYAATTTFFITIKTSDTIAVNDNIIANFPAGGVTVRQSSLPSNFTQGPVAAVSSNTFIAGGSASNIATPCATTTSLIGTSCYLDATTTIDHSMVISASTTVVIKAGEVSFGSTTASTTLYNNGRLIIEPGASLRIYNSTSTLENAQSGVIDLWGQIISNATSKVVNEGKMYINGKLYLGGTVDYNGNLGLGTAECNSSYGGAISGGTVVGSTLPICSSAAVSRPNVVYAYPQNAASNVPAGQPVRLLFSFDRNMGVGSIVSASTSDPASNIFLTNDNGATRVGGQIAYYASQADCNAAENNYCQNNNLPNLGVFTPDAYLSPLRNYELRFLPGVHDVSGNSLNPNNNQTYYSLQFSTGPLACSGSACYVATTSAAAYGAYSPPKVLGMLPMSSSFNAPINSLVSVKFDKPLLASTVNASSIKVYKVNMLDWLDGAQVALADTNISLNSDGTVITISPAGNLEANAKYRVRLFGSLTGSNGVHFGGIALNDNLPMWSSEFNTGAGASSAHPQISYIYPSNGQSAIPTTLASVRLQASLQLNPDSINNQSVSVISADGTPLIGQVKYEPLSRVISFIPGQMLATGTTYTVVASTSIADFTTGKNSLTSTSSSFTTAAMVDSVAPAIIGASANDYRVEVYFNIPVDAKYNSSSSVLNLLNIIEMRQGSTTDIWQNFSPVSTSSLAMSYEAENKKLIIEGLGMEIGKDFYLKLSPAIKGTNGQPLSAGNSVRGHINPQGNASTGNTATVSGLAMEKAAGSPVSNLTGLKTSYKFKLPITKQINSGGQIMIIFPANFDLANAKPLPGSAYNSDFNGSSAGAPAFDNSFDADGVFVDALSNTIVVKIIGSSMAGGADILNFELGDIGNSLMSTDLSSQGYKVVFQTKNAVGTILENIEALPFYLQSAGANSLNVNVRLADNSDGGSSKAKIYLDSSATGPVELLTDSFNATAAVFDATANVNGLPEGDYTLYSDPIIRLNGMNYAGVNPPVSFHLSSGVTNREIILNRDNAGSSLSVSVSGPANQALDVFASGINGFKKQALILDGSGSGSATFNLPNGDWFVGVGPQMGSSSSGVTFASLDFVIPASKKIIVGSSSISFSGSTTSSLSFNLAPANKLLRGTVTDLASSTSPIANAEVWAYDPQGGFGTNARADINGQFVLKLISGKFKIGASVPGLPRSREVSVEITGSGAVVVDGALQSWNISTSAFDKFLLKLAKPDHIISGLVTDSYGSPVKNAAVWAYQVGNAGYANAQTDSDGRYQLYVGNGTWNVSSYLNGYGQLPVNTIYINDASQENVNFSPASANAYIYKTVSGKVCVGSADSQDHDCADGAALAQSYVYAETVLGGSAKSLNVTTDSNGQFTLKLAVPTGGSSASYTLRAWNSDYGNFPPQTLNLTSSSPDIDPSGHDFEKNAVQEAMVSIKDNAGAAVVVPDAAIELRDATGSLSNYLNIRNSNSGAIKLPSGNYQINVHLPGIDSRSLLFKVDGATTSTLTIAGTSTSLEVLLPVRHRLSGRVLGTSDNIWVEAVDEVKGIHFGTLATSTGGVVNYSIDLPAGNYSLVASKPGFIGTRSTTSIADTDRVADLVVSSATVSLSGKVTTASSTGANFAYVRAEKANSDIVMGVQADAEGNYTLPVIGGDWRLYALGNGYKEKYYGSVVTVGAGSLNNINFVLSDRVELVAPLSQPIIPAQGGTINASDMGLRLTIPANALNSDNSSGNISVNDISNIARSSLASPLGNRGREITAKDANGQEINNLRSGVTLELSYSRADLDAYLPSIFGTSTWSALSDAEKLAKVKNLKLSYWNETSGAWIEQPSIVVLISSSTITPATYADIESVSVKGDTTHFTVFAVIMPFVVNNTENNSNSNNNNNNNSGGSNGGGGGGSVSAAYCETVVYSDWGACTNSSQSRTIKSLSPSGCTLTSAQENAKKQACTLPKATTTIATPVIEQVQAVVKKVTTNLTRLMDYLLGKLGLKRNPKKEAANEPKYVKPIIKSVQKVTPEHKTTVTTFVNYGTFETEKLSDGERSLVVRSYRQIFGKLPSIEKEWQDVIRIATEQVPKERNIKAELAAQKTFIKVYKRKPNFKNANDKKAMDILSYGLLPLKKDLKLEAAAIKKFKAVYKKNPKTDEDWKITRAIAYSKIKK